MKVRVTQIDGALPNLALMKLSHWHKAQGDLVVIVSGAFDLYLSPWCSQHQVELICSQLETKDDVLTGRYRGEQCVGKEKSRRIREKYRVSDFPVVYAYGDTEEDQDMLSMANRKYFQWQEIA